MKLRHLEKTLEGVLGFSDPNPFYEQYQTPPFLAARLLFDALMQGDIEGKTICDLGSGTGILAIGASLLGASLVKGVEIDKKAIEIAKDNCKQFLVDVEFIERKITPTIIPELGNFDTIVMNPPFGAQNVHADRPFIDVAIECGQIIYGIFNEGSLHFVESYCKERALIESAVSGSIPIKNTFHFHRKEVVTIKVEILKLRRL